MRWQQWLKSRQRAAYQYWSAAPCCIFAPCCMAWQNCHKLTQRCVRKSTAMPPARDGPPCTPCCKRWTLSRQSAYIRLTASGSSARWKCAWRAASPCRPCWPRPNRKNLPTISCNSPYSRLIAPYFTSESHSDSMPCCALACLMKYASCAAHTSFPWNYPPCVASAIGKPGKLWTEVSP